MLLEKNMNEGIVSPSRGCHEWVLMKTDELNHNIDELKYAYSFWSPKILTVHKGLFEDELEDSIHKRKAEVKRKKKKPPTTLGLYNLFT